MAAKRLNRELPAWVDVSCGVGGLALIAIALMLLLRTFLDWIGVPVLADSPWPATFLYAAISVALILAAGYLPARLSASPAASSRKTHWEPALAESFLSHLDNLQAPSTPRLKVKVLATNQGKSPAELLVKVLEYCGWDVEVNHDDGSYIFPAKSPFSGTLIKYRKSRFQEYYAVSQAVAALIYQAESAHFPEDDAFNFIQVEVGDVPQYYSGPPQFVAI
jgi:hypothetical protein